MPGIIHQQSCLHHFSRNSFRGEGVAEKIPFTLTGVVGVGVDAQNGSFFTRKPALFVFTETFHTRVRTSEKTNWHQ